MSKPGQGRPDTQSYDRVVEPDRGGRSAPAARPEVRPTLVMPEGLAENGAATDEPPARPSDPLAAGPVPQAHLSLTPEARDAVVDQAPGAFRAGDVVDHFEIVGLVGQGGMGCVYKAFDRELGRTVAIKTLHGIDQQAPQALARFRREAQAASRVVHPNLVIIYSAGSYEGTPYIAMEYLSGRNLAAEIAQGRIGIERTADVLGAACAGVYAAHRVDVVHRDLKPANIFLAKTPMGETPKILDFGISRIGDDNSSLTGTGDIVGTTYYLAPEQAAGRPIDARVDQYALGVILYECLTGVRPFTGSAVFEIMRNIMGGKYQPPSQLCPDIPGELETVVMRAMNRTPENRFARVRDLGLALVPFMSTKGRQQWGHHFMAPEAEMPVAHSLALPVSPGVKPAAAPAQPAATKVIVEPWQVAPTNTLPPEDDASELPLTPQKRQPVRRHNVLALTAIAVSMVALVGLGLFVALRRPVVARPPAHPAVTKIPAVTAEPPVDPPAVSEPVPPPPSAAPSSPPIPIQAADPVEERARDQRKKTAGKIGKPQEADELVETAETKPSLDEAPKPLKTGMW